MDLSTGLNIKEEARRAFISLLSVSVPKMTSCFKHLLSSLTHHYLPSLPTVRVCLLLSKGHSCYRPRRTGKRKHKSVRGCIVDSNLSVLNLVIVKKGEKDIPGLTDNTVPRRLGPKRASRIRKLFNLSKEDDAHQYVVRKPLNKESKKPRTKALKIQRLVTPRVLQHKRIA
ncbi:hypothetical protein STEG23_003054 [Scotinomys teguina]